MKVKYLILLLLLSFNGYCTDTLYVNSISDKRLILYNDSLKLFNSSNEVKSKLLSIGYVIVGKTPWEDSGELSMQEIANYVDFGKLPPNPKNRERYELKTFQSILAEKVGNLYKVLDFYPLTINNRLGFQYFSMSIKPKSVKEYGFKGYKDDDYNDGRLVYEYNKPVVVVVYKPYKPLISHTNTQPVAKIDTNTTKCVNVIYQTKTIKDEVKVDSVKKYIVQSSFNFLTK